ncbi:MAG: SMC family ATPase [Planctomycetes bacterium]|nr:SMC family ATPase [Planctomycetota bacterium]
MIPQRVKLSGFLSYKDEQEIRFDESPLWMLSGTNGSGKSSIFDAVTYALFGHHRGGSQSASELINKESSTLAVEFDFTVEKQLYRIKRTVRRRTSGVASTQQVMKFLPSATLTPEESWEALPDTTYKAKFDAWVKDKIGLDYETFTSSVLLLQGKSEKLLDSTPAGRAGVLARIVDLERFQKLHGKADDKRRELKAQLEGISNQLSGIREVTDEELAEASVRIATAEDARTQAQEKIDSLVTLELKARGWDAAQKKLVAARAKLSSAEGVLKHAVAIENEYHRLRELRDVLPAVGTIVTERGRIGESERKTEQLTKQQAIRTDDRRKTENTLEQSRKKRDALKKTLAEDEAKQTTLNARLRELAGVLEKVKQVEDAETEVKRLEVELKPLPGDPDATVRQFQQEQERLALLAQHIAQLDRLHTDRSELTKAVTTEKQARADETKLKQEGVKAKEEFTALEAKAKATRDDRATKEQSAAEARALARQAKELADEFVHLSGEKTCRACGQALTEKHFADEKKKRDLNAKAAERKLETLTKDVAVVRKLEEELNAKEAADREHLTKLREQYVAAAAASKQAAQDIKRLTESCRLTYFGLPQEYKDRIGKTEPADWSKATYPDRHDLTTLSDEAKQIDSVKRKLRVAQEESKKVGELRAKLESARERGEKARRSLPAGDPAAVREEFTTKQADEKAVTANIAATKKAITTTDTEVDRQQRDLSNIDRELTEYIGKLNLEESSRKQSAEAVERAKKALPLPWQKPAETAGLNDRAKWQDELDALNAKGIEKKFTELQAARGGLDSLRAEISQFEEEADAFPEEARRNPEDVKAEGVAARKEHDARNKELNDAQSQKRILDDYRRQRGELGEQYKAIDIDFNRHETLTKLLGRDRLQRWLVEKAESQIVDFANGVLDRLSGGQMYLRQVKSETGTEKAFDLECSNRATGGSPINVAFLSGSQRFRVAVALALGIGQYASKQHRPIESVIIDEGFGCLDRAGRQVMIQELQNLRGHLHCILLVSHQEEFADAFPDGYRFELQDGATHVSRFVR